MAVALSQVCDPEVFALEEAIEIVRNRVAVNPVFEFHLAHFLQLRCLSAYVSRPTIYRGLEILSEVLQGTEADVRRLPIIRPFLKSSDLQIASKAALVFGKQSRDIGWVRRLVQETDRRVRANLIESLWSRADPEIEGVFHSALRDPYPRVAANAAYGLYLMENLKWTEALDSLLTSDDAACRCSGIWVFKSVATPRASPRLRPLIRDSDPNVRRAAFDALRHVREKYVGWRGS